ncbi:MAG: PIG-L family deacetylase [Kiritimatiellae bacterium]|nr:PIG-L family deacetylase [Kiritimatiellia bacterium]
MIVLAMAAHPDDIEFMMSGTLLLLKQAGADIHICNLANGCYGSEVMSKEETARVRAGEAQASAELAGATLHPSFFDDLGIFYDAPSLAKVTAVVRSVQPDIILTLPMHDYMEDHCLASRLTCSAAFNRGCPCYVSDPPVPSYSKPVAIYHALPHSMMDMERKPAAPDFVVDVATVMEMKEAMLSKHVSQKEWLDSTQGMSSYINNMINSAQDVGSRFSSFNYAEGWVRHNHTGYCGSDFDPVRELLGDLIFNYE